MSDFVAPEQYEDYIGTFAVTCGIGVESMKKRYREENDDFNVILTDSIADRLVEACTEMIHKRVRNETWGYSDEDSSVEDLIHMQYQGIRPAPGYPVQPDHHEKLILWELGRYAETIGIELTDSYAMLPAASVCGLYFAHPDAKYFSVGHVYRDQVVDYARRKNLSQELVEELLSQNLSYCTH